MVRHDVVDSVTKLGLLQAQHTLADLLLQNLPCVFVLGHLEHARSHEPLVVEGLFALGRTFLVVLFVLFALEARIVQLGVERVLDHLHSLHQRSGVARFDDLDVLLVEVYFLLSLLVNRLSLALLEALG